MGLLDLEKELQGKSWASNWLAVSNGVLGAGGRVAYMTP
jgi:hypothetical protein